MPVVSRFPFSGGLISRLGRSDFRQAAVYIPFWNGVNIVFKTYEQFKKISQV